VNYAVYMRSRDTRALVALMVHASDEANAAIKALTEGAHRGLHSTIEEMEPTDELREHWAKFKQAYSSIGDKERQAFLEERCSALRSRSGLPPQSKPPLRCRHCSAPEGMLHSFKCPERVGDHKSVRIGIDPALGKDMAVMALTGRQQYREWLDGCSKPQYREWLQGEFKVDPSPTPLMEQAVAAAAAMWGKKPTIVIPDGVVEPEPKVPAGYTAEELDRDNPYNAWFTPEPVEHVEPASTTPRGLMMLSPMDGRLGNRWSPE
jgi:hypothetical protein